MKAPALIVVDMLNDFLQAWAPAAKQRLVRSTNALVGMADRSFGSGRNSGRTCGMRFRK
jgi:hypothetical protein